MKISKNIRFLALISVAGLALKPVMAAATCTDIVAPNCSAVIAGHETQFYNWMAISDDDVKAVKEAVCAECGCNPNTATFNVIYSMTPPIIVLNPGSTAGNVFVPLSKTRGACYSGSRGLGGGCVDNSIQEMCTHGENVCGQGQLTNATFNPNQTCADLIAAKLKRAQDQLNTRPE